MIPEPWVIEELRRHQERREEAFGLPLHAPSPLRVDEEPPFPSDREEESSTSRVLIIDLNDYTERL